VSPARKCCRQTSSHLAAESKTPGVEILRLCWCELEPPFDQRFENHKNGYKSAWVVKKYGLRLMPELYEHLNPMPFKAAAQMEIELAEDLRAQGYTVIAKLRSPNLQRKMGSVSGSTGWECARSSTKELQGAILEAMPERERSLLGEVDPTSLSLLFIVPPNRKTRSSPPRDRVGSIL
jgi:hypothetical protein